MFGKIGVNVFVIITAYYCCKSNFKAERLVTTELMILFFSVFLVLVSVICSPVFGISIGKKQIIKCFFPVIFGNYWYATAYVILLLFMPFINKFLHCLSRNEYRIMIIIIIGTYSIVPMFIGSIWSAFGINNYVNFLIAYILGGYLSMYMPTWNRKIIFWCLMACITIQLIFPVIADLLLASDSKVSYWVHDLKCANSLTSLIISVTLFWLVVNVNPCYKKGLNAIATITFPAYLVHEHIIFRPILWQKVLKVSFFQDSILFPLEMVSSIIIIFFIAWVIYIEFKVFYKFIGYKISKLLSHNKLFDCLENISLDENIDNNINCQN